MKTCYQVKVLDAVLAIIKVFPKMNTIDPTDQTVSSERPCFVVTSMDRYCASCVSDWMRLMNSSSENAPRSPSPCFLTLITFCSISLSPITSI